MEFRPLEIPDVILIEPDVHRDERGFFLETWHAGKYIEAGIEADFVQDNHSRSGHCTLRGLHAQLRNPQGKLMRVTEGEIFDVAVDIRPDSPSFGGWVAAILSKQNFNQLWIPPGFAHGFCVLSEAAEIEYKCTALYDPGGEIAVRWDDPAIGIDWPCNNPLLSKRDAEAPLLDDLVPRLREAAGAGEE